MIIEGNFCGKNRRIEAADGIIKRVDVEESPHMRFDDKYIVFPGFIDIHVHLREDQSGKWSYKETFETGAEAALNGGVMAVLDQPNTPVPCVNARTLREKKELARNAPINIYFNAGIGPETHPIRGHKFYKLFTTESVGGIYLTDYKSIEEKLKEYVDKVPDLHLCVHCEDDEVIKAVGRTINSEVKAIIEMINIGEKLKIPQLHIYHVSTEGGVRNIREAKKSYSGLSCSATPHHLYFDTKNVIYSTQDSNTFMNPPLRGREHIETLHDAIKDSTIDCIASDHAPHTLKDKKKGMAGVPQLDTFGMFAMHLMRDREVKSERIAELFSYFPGRFLGRKIGKIEPGYEASFTVLKEDCKKVTKRMLKTKCRWSPFEEIYFPGSVAGVFYQKALKY